MATFLMVLHIFVCVILVFVVLIQSGKEGGLGMMGGGGSQTVFGSSGGANFFTKFTSATAAVFMITSIFLSVTKGGKKSSVFADQPGQTQTAPAPATKPLTGENQAPANTGTTPPAATEEKKK